MENKYLLSAFADEAGDTAEEQIEALKANDMSLIEVRLFGSQFICRMPLDEVKEIKRKFDDGGIKVWSLGSSIGKIKIHEDFDEHIETLKHCLEVANILETDNMRMFSFYMPKEEDPAIYKNEVMDRMGKMLEVAKGSGIKLCHENEKGIYGDNAARCLEILTTFPDYAGVFDPANFVQCGQDTIEAWKMLKPYIKYLHIKDAVADGTVVAAGKGIGNLEYIVNDYLAGVGKVMTLEPHLTNFTAQAVLEGKEVAENKDVLSPRREAFDYASNSLKALIK